MVLPNFCNGSKAEMTGAHGLSRRSIVWRLEVRWCIKQTLDTAIHVNVRRMLTLGPRCRVLPSKYTSAVDSIVSLEKSVEGRDYAAKASLTRLNACAMAISK